MENLKLYIKEALVNHKVKNVQSTLTVGEIINNYFRQILPASYLNHIAVIKYDNLLDVKKPTLKKLFDNTPLRFIYLRGSRFVSPVCTWSECYRIFQQEKNNEPNTFEQEYDSIRNEYKIELIINGIDKRIYLRTKEEIK